MITIRLITKNDYQKLVDWNKGKDEKFLYQWAGTKVYQYPITVEQIKKRTTADDTFVFSIEENDEVVGSVELSNIDYERSCATICRFILDEHYRGLGIGGLALKKMAELAFVERKLGKLYLRVYCYNIGAIRCYENSGFRVIEYQPGSSPEESCYTMELCKNEKDGGQ